MKVYNQFMLSLIGFLLFVTGFAYAARGGDADMTPGLTLTGDLVFQMLLGQVGWLVKKDCSLHPVWAILNGIAIFGLMFWMAHGVEMKIISGFWPITGYITLSMSMIQLEVLLVACAIRRLLPNPDTNAASK